MSNKKEALNLFDGSGVQFPESSIKDGLNHSIFDAGSSVNKKNRVRRYGYKQQRHACRFLIEKSLDPEVWVKQHSAAAQGVHQGFKKDSAPVNGQQGRVPSGRAETSESPALRRLDPSDSYANSLCWN